MLEWVKTEVISNISNINLPYNIDDDGFIEHATINYDKTKTVYNQHKPLRYPRYKEIVLKKLKFKEDRERLKKVQKLNWIIIENYQVVRIFQD